MTFFCILIEKWTTNEEDLQTNSLIATYPFTSPIIDVCITDYVIHALTDHGIETYTHRIGHKLFCSAYEYGLRDDPCVIEVNLNSFCSFFNLKHFLRVDLSIFRRHRRVSKSRSV